MSNALMKSNGQSPLTNRAVEENKRKMAAVFGLASVYGSQVDENATKLWLSLLKTYSVKQVEAGVERLMQREEAYKMPPPSVLIRYINDIEEEQKLARFEEWQKKCRETMIAKKKARERYELEMDLWYRKRSSKSISLEEYARGVDVAYDKYKTEFARIEESHKQCMLELSHGKV